MNTYVFYSKHDTSKEAIGRIDAANIVGAICYFAETKRLTRELFINMYEVACQHPSIAA